MGAPGTEGGFNRGGKASAPASSSTNTQGLATLIVMIAVLTIIILFCCFAAPGVRELCKRYIFRSCVIDDPDEDNVYTRRFGQSDRYHVESESEKKQGARRESQRRQR